MLILLIGSHCKICPLPVCIVGNGWKWATFTMGPNEQNQHFAELRQNVCLYIHVVVLLRCLPSLDDKLERFVTKKWKKRLPNSSQTDYSTLCSYHGRRYLYATVYQQSGIRSNIVMCLCHNVSGCTSVYIDSLSEWYRYMAIHIRSVHMASYVSML